MCLPGALMARSISDRVRISVLPAELNGMRIRTTSRNWRVFRARFSATGRSWWIELVDPMATPGGVGIGDLIWLPETKMRRTEPCLLLSQGVQRVETRRDVGAFFFADRRGLLWRDTPLAQGRVEAGVSRPPPHFDAGEPDPRACPAALVRHHGYPGTPWLWVWAAGLWLRAALPLSDRAQVAQQPS